MNKEAIISEIKNLRAGLPYADGPAYSQDVLRISRLENELRNLNNTNKSLDDSHVVAYNKFNSEQRAEAINKARKARIAEAVKSMSDYFNR